MDLISIVVPVYKVEEYLERCIKSILYQTYGNIEVILVDDGSPDNCPAICDEWKEKDSRIRVIHKKNGGLSDARNVGLKLAEGTYVAFIDSDDYIHPQFIECLYFIMKREMADVVSCSYKRVNEDSCLTLTSDICCESIQIKQLTEITPANIGIQAWNKLYKKSLFDKVQFPVGKIHEDVGIWYEMIYYAKKIAAISEELYFYCENPTSIMRRVYTMKHMDLIDVIYMQYIKFKELRENEYASQILKDCINAYPGLYVHLNDNPDFSLKDKKDFKRDYRQKLKEAIKDKNINIGVKIKNVLYMAAFPMMMFIYKYRQKEKDVM